MSGGGPGIKKPVQPPGNSRVVSSITRHMDGPQGMIHQYQNRSQNLPGGPTIVPQPVLERANNPNLVSPNTQDATVGTADSVRVQDLHNNLKHLKALVNNAEQTLTHMGLSKPAIVPPTPSDSNSQSVKVYDGYKSVHNNNLVHCHYTGVQAQAQGNDSATDNLTQYSDNPSNDALNQDRHSTLTTLVPEARESVETILPLSQKMRGRETLNGPTSCHAVNIIYEEGPGEISNSIPMAGESMAGLESVEELEALQAEIQLGSCEVNSDAPVGPTPEDGGILEMGRELSGSEIEGPGADSHSASQSHSYDSRTQSTAAVSSKNNSKSSVNSGTDMTATGRGFKRGTASSRRRTALNAKQGLAAMAVPPRKLNGAGVTVGSKLTTRGTGGGLAEALAAVTASGGRFR